MKVNKAPEKIYIQPDAQDCWFIVNNLNNTLVEYTRTDAFIEKAAKWIEACNICDYFVKPTEDSTYIAFDVKMYVEEFKKAMREDNL